MKQLLLSLVLLLILSACSTTKVHVFTQGLEQREQQQISSTLKKQGFEVRLVGLQPPVLPTATIIYSPALPNISDIQRISSSLAKLGYADINLIAVSKDNQSYTGRNVGLYLAEASINANSGITGQAIPSDFAGYCDKSDAYLTLRPEGEFQLKVVSWDQFDNEKIKTSTGTWALQKGSLELAHRKSLASKFDIEKSERSDGQNIYTKTTLSSTQNSSALTNCRFVTTIVGGNQ